MMLAPLTTGIDLPQKPVATSGSRQWLAAAFQVEKNAIKRDRQRANLFQALASARKKVKVATAKLIASDEPQAYLGL
jgi:hypothetical protein